MNIYRPAVTAAEQFLHAGFCVPEHDANVRFDVFFVEMRLQLLSAPAPGLALIGEQPLAAQLSDLALISTFPVMAMVRLQNMTDIGRLADVVHVFVKEPEPGDARKLDGVLQKKLNGRANELEIQVDALMVLRTPDRFFSSFLLHDSLFRSR